MPLPNPPQKPPKIPYLSSPDAPATKYSEDFMPEPRSYWVISIADTATVEKRKLESGLAYPDCMLPGEFEVAAVALTSEEAQDVFEDYCVEAQTKMKHPTIMTVNVTQRRFHNPPKTVVWIYGEPWLVCS